MGWLSKAKGVDKGTEHLQDFGDRNRVNAAIRNLTSLSETLRYCADLVYQTNRGARRMVSQISESKVLSSYPTVVDMLLAADSMALDSPKRFSEACSKAAGAIETTIASLEEDRNIFVQQTLPGKLKGLVDDE